MTYEGNMLTSVRDQASHSVYAGATDFDGIPGQEYPLTYNDAGSLTSDAGRRIAWIDYDLMNNPVRIQFTNGNVTKYVYSATGEKLRVTYQTAVPNITVPIGSTRELAFYEVQYTDSTDYLLGGRLTLKNGRIDKYQFEEGYCQAGRYSDTEDVFAFYYYDRDHLGSIRQVLKAKTGSVVQSMNYYPFGTQFCDGSTDSNVQSHRYNGKEFDKMHGLNTYDYGARQYNPVTARWDRVDPLAEKYYSLSPYNYCGNNPINAIDIDGEDNYTINSSGQVSILNKTDDKFDVLMLSTNHNTMITLQDQNILKQLSIRRNDYGGGQYGIMNNLNESVKLFKFVADNTNVEWGLDAFRDSNGNEKFQIRTSNDMNVVRTNYTMQNIGNMKFTMHSHSRVNGNDNASGAFGSGQYSSNASTPDSDYDTYIRLNGRYQQIKGKGHVVPHFLYNARTKNFFEYDCYNNSINKHRIISSNNIIKYIRKRL